MSGSYTKRRKNWTEQKKVEFIQEKTSLQLEFDEMRSKRNREQIMSVLFALLNILLLLNGTAANAIEEAEHQYQVKRSANG